MSSPLTFWRWIFITPLLALAFIWSQAPQLLNRSHWMNQNDSTSTIETDPVRRIKFDASVNAPGEIQSANNTIVECEIERLSVMVQGRSITSGSSTTILKIIPDGSMVKKDDVLCVLDSSEFEELARLQRINVERAKADKLEAEMNLEVAKIALDEYRLGTAKQMVQSLKGQIALAQSDSTRLTSRLDWSRKMLHKGYASRTSVRSEELALQRSDLQLTQAEFALRTFEKYSKPKVEHTLQVRIRSLQTMLRYEESRLKRHQDRLETYTKQISKCTVRAPNDGMAIYANEPDGDSRIEEGSQIREGQDIFLLPELNNMQALVKLSESIVQKVQRGMKAKVLVEALNGQEFEGHVETIAQFPMPPSSWRMAQDVKNYLCVVKIDSKSDDLRPGLNSEIQFLTGSGEDSLTISPEVVQVEKDREFCYVRKPDGRFEKREIKTKTGDPDTLEIIKGLKEGEQVVRKPDRMDDLKDFIDGVVTLNVQPELEEQAPLAFSDPVDDITEGSPSTATVITIPDGHLNGN
jgi:HlyD family secretion protein